MTNNPLEQHSVLEVCKEKFKVTEETLVRHSKRLWGVWVTIITLIIVIVGALYSVSESRLSIDSFGEYQERMEKAGETAQETRDAVIRMEIQLQNIEDTLNGEGG